MGSNECYRVGGYGPYEMLPCADCPASKPTYAEARIYISKEAAPKPIKVVFEDDWVMRSTGEYEFEINRPLTKEEKQKIIEFINSI